MVGKITAAAAVAALLASAGVASAQTPRPYVGRALQPPMAQSYYNEDYWRAIAPNQFDPRDPYVGTVWYGIAPY